jgi:hypothetical protein
MFALETHWSIHSDTRNNGPHRRKLFCKINRAQDKHGTPAERGLHTAAVL